MCIRGFIQWVHPLTAWQTATSRYLITDKHVTCSLVKIFGGNFVTCQILGGGKLPSGGIKFTDMLPFLLRQINRMGRLQKNRATLRPGEMKMSLQIGPLSLMRF